MKKKVSFILLFLLVLSSSLIIAAETNSTEAKAYACLESKVNNKCSTLSTEEKIFSFLAIGKCKEELLADESSVGCWPKSDCSIKTTAQSILALRKSGGVTTEAEDWILSQSISFTNVEWFLQIETTNKSSCTVSYSDNSYVFLVGEDKSLSRSAGKCLSVYDDYWFRVSPSCYEEEFSISCEGSFWTSLLYQKKNSPATYDFYVSDKTNSASGDGTTTEKIKSSCFSETKNCDYEGTLWSAIVLKSLGKDVSAYIPYLITMADDNSKYLPESFLYILTNNFKIELLAKQKESKYWFESGNKFYDTAVALFPFQNEETLTEKTNSKAWLKDMQGNNGCWQDNIRDTAFLLYSLWARKMPDVKDCETSSYFCSSTAACSSATGKVLTEYSGCLGTNICCDKEEEIKSCTEQGGKLCSSDEECINGVEVTASDSSGKVCCAKGTCEIPEETEESECELNDGTCKSTCSSGEKSTSDYCPLSDICCTTQSKGSYLWLIILFSVLIVLTVVGIIFRKQLRELLIRIKSKFGKGKPSTTQPIGRFPPAYPRPYSRTVPTTVTKTVTKTFSKPVLKTASSSKLKPKKSEIDDVLKKLKEIGK